MQIKNRQQWLTLLAVLAVGLLAGQNLILGPLYDLWKARGKRIAELRRQVSEGERLLQREQSIRSRWEQMQSNTLTNNTSVAEQRVLKAVDTWAQSSRVTVTSITPQWRRDSEEYRTLQCRIDASGSLGTVSRFLYEMEKDPMALKVESVELSARDNEGQQISLGLQVSGLVLTPPPQ